MCLFSSFTLQAKEKIIYKALKIDDHYLGYFLLKEFFVILSEKKDRDNPTKKERAKERESEREERKRNHIQTIIVI